MFSRPFDPSLPSIEESAVLDDKKAPKPQSNASRPSRRRPKRTPVAPNFRPVNHGPGRFLHPRRSSAGDPAMADEAAAASTPGVTEPQSGAVKASGSPAPTAPDSTRRNSSRSQYATAEQEQGRRDSAGTEAHDSNYPKLDPSGFFTLVGNIQLSASSTSTSGQQIHHPHVKYIFADDDPSVLDAAIAESHAQNAAADASGNSAPRHHAILVDVVPATDSTGGEGGTGGPSGWKVVSASSLSGRFAVADAKISRMEDSSAAADATVKSVAEDQVGRQETADGGALMLKIEGYEITDEDEEGDADLVASLSGSQDAGRSVASGEKEDYAALLEQFDRNMAVYRQVAAAAERRAIKMDEEQGGEEWEGGHVGKEDPTHPDQRPDETKDNVKDVADDAALETDKGKGVNN